MMSSILNRLRINRLIGQFGYSLIELVVVIIILSIISAVTLNSLKSTVEIARIEETKNELRQLANAITGDPEKISGGNRIDFGYVGDVGSLPPDLDALISNPGGYTTWNGPYIRDDFYSSSGSTEYEFKLDGWGKPYTYNGLTISSSGGGSSITRHLASSVDKLLYNSVSVIVTDLYGSSPGPTYQDSVTISIIYPDGTGNITTVTRNPSYDGHVQFDSIPVGTHDVVMVYTTLLDSIQRSVTIAPGQNQYLTIRYYHNVI